MAWKRTSFSTYRRDKRSLKVGNVAESADRNRTAAENLTSALDGDIP